MGLVGRPLGLGGAHRGVGNRSRGDLSRIHILYSGIKSLVRELVFVALRWSALQCPRYSARATVRYSIRFRSCVLQLCFGKSKFPVRKFSSGKLAINILGCPGASGFIFLLFLFFGCCRMLRFCVVKIYYLST